MDPYAGNDLKSRRSELGDITRDMIRLLTYNLIHQVDRRMTPIRDLISTCRTSTGWRGYWSTVYVIIRTCTGTHTSVVTMMLPLLQPSLWTVSTIWPRIWHPRTSQITDGDLDLTKERGI